MRFKSVIIFIIVFALFLALGGFIFGSGIQQKSLVKIISGSAIIIISIVSLYNYYNRINYKLTYFFDALRNDDTSLNFSEKVKNTSMRRLHHSLNQTNLLIKKWKKESEKREHFYMNLIEHSNTGLVVFDEEGYTSVINSKAKHYLGLHVNSNIKILRQKNVDLFNLLSELKPNKERTIRTLINNEPAFLSIGLSTLKYDNIVYRLFSIKDIKQELDEKELDSWQKLIRVLTHEIMNSIAPITSLTGTISAFFKNNDKVLEPKNITHEIIEDTLEGLEVIEERGKGLKKFVESYRSMSKLPEPKFKTIKLESLFKKLLQLSKPFSSKKEIETKTIIKGLTHIFADEELLMQVLINLVKNSCEASNNNNRVCIEIIGTYNLQRNPLIIIKDNGVSIPPEIQERMFIPFFTTKENGSGIGLSLCRQIMRLQNGTIHITSNENEGTSAVLTFY